MNERLKLLRKALKLNQLEFAEKIQIGRSTLAGYENGLTNMTDRSIRDICRVFYVNEDWLRTGEGNMFRARNTTNEELALQIGKLLKTDDEFTKNLFLEYLKLPPEMKTLFEDFVHNLAKSKEPANKKIPRTIYGTGILLCLLN